MTNNPEDTIQKALKMIHGLRSGTEADVTGDEEAKQLVLKSMRVNLLEELAALQEVHFIALMQLLCSTATEHASMERLVEQLKDASTTLKPADADWVVSFIKLLRVRLSGYTGGVRL